MRAMILAAGFGTRLWPLTVDRTKPAIPVLGRPLIGHVAAYLAGAGIREVLVNLHHEGESVRRALGNGSDFGVKLTYVEEPEILGTSGALDNARPLLEDSPFVVINGKIITDIDLTAAIEAHKEADALATLVLLPNIKRERFSEVLTAGGLVTGFGGMPAATSDLDTGSPLMFTGIQILSPRIFSYIPRGRFSHSTTDVYPQAIAAGERIIGHVASGSWYELSTIPRYLEISLHLMREQQQKVYLGPGSRISPSGEVENSILWERVVVGDGARIDMCVIADGVNIPSGEIISNAAVVRADLVAGITAPEKALKGEFKGANFVVPLYG
jgi:NDP-sugar pyrophosphorylase family protein